MFTIEPPVDAVRHDVQASILSGERLRIIRLAAVRVASQTLDFKDPEVGKLVAKSSFSTVGKKNAYTYKAYHYNFVCDVVLEFKDGKTRYTLENFKKKSSPGEPGSTLEYFIDNYKPKISSQKSRDREAKMLDAIELAIQDQVWDLIDEIKKTFGPKSSDDW